MKRLVICLAIIAVCVQGMASELKISTPILYMEDAAAYAVFNIEWKNSWNNSRNHDAIWLFCKSKTGIETARHIGIANSGHTVVSTYSSGSPALAFKVAPDQVGLWVFPSQSFRGDISATVKVELQAEDFEGINTRNAAFQVFGIEMVHIPSGNFLIGSAEESAQQKGAFFDPATGGMIGIEEESGEWEVAADGDLYYQASEGYEGDQKGRISASFPKGHQAFFMMKYELMEGQYAAMLNSLDGDQRQTHIVHGMEDYEGSLYEENGLIAARTPTRPAPFIGWDDAMAFADWAGLRPMTEFEFTKASRGSAEIEAIDFPWGSESKWHVQRLPGQDGTLVMMNGWNEQQLSDENKKSFGASFYWVMDLAGSLWERVVSVGHENGRQFLGSHGDGTLSAAGSATNTDWPVGQEDAGGIGFRGGGFYGYSREYHEFNPFSPVAFRPYGSWHGSMRSLAYGTRFVRTAD